MRPRLRPRRKPRFQFAPPATSTNTATPPRSKNRDLTIRILPLQFLKLFFKKLRSFLTQKSAPAAAFRTWMLLLVIVGTGIFLYKLGSFTITEIECSVTSTTASQNETPNCPDFVTAELNKFTGQAFFATSLQPQLVKIMALVPSLTNPTTTLILPHRINVRFKAADSRYALTTDQETFLVIDQSGSVISQTVQNSLPLIQTAPEFFNTLAVRSQIEPDLHQAVLFFLSQDHLNSSQLQLQITADRQLVAVLSPEFLRTNQKVTVLMNEDNFPAQLTKLGAIIEYFTTNPTVPDTLKKNLSSIDLRFKYPILKTTP